MPDPRNLPDPALAARAQELHRLIFRDVAERSPGNERFVNRWTIAIMEIVHGIETTHIVTANDPRAYKVLEANRGWLRPYERLEGASIPYYEEVEGRSPSGRRRSNRRNIDAEQVALIFAIDAEAGPYVVRIAASRPICPACIESYLQLLPRVRLINPDPRQLPPRRAQPPRPPPPRRRMPGPSLPRGSTYTPGQRTAAGAVLVIQAANFFAEHYVEHREQDQYERALRAEDGFIRRCQEERPTVGILVIADWEGANFRRIEFAFGMNEIQARSAMPPQFSGTETRLTGFIQPLQRPDVTSLPPPLPPIMLATFYRRQVFQNLEFRVGGFDVFGGFDDDGETDLGYPQSGQEALFWILRPPARVRPRFGGRPADPREIDIIRWPLVSGENVECVDLDPTRFSSGSDCAFPAYPADVATDATFQRVRGISDNIGALYDYDFDRVRWIAPHRARSIGLRSSRLDPTETIRAAARRVARGR